MVTMEAEIKVRTVTFLCEFQLKGEERTTPTDESQLGCIYRLMHGTTDVLYMMEEMGFEHEIRAGILQSKHFL